MTLPLSYAKRKYKKQYVEKRKTDSGEVRIYSEEHVKQRWKKKVEKLKKLEKGIEKLRKQYKADLKDENDAKTRAIAALVGLMDNTAMRVGNDASAEEKGTFGATTLKKKHAKVQGNKIRFKFKGKSGVDQDVLLDDAAVASEIKKLLKGKKDNDFIFEYEEGQRISPKIVNNYLKEFDITAKDIRGFHANRLFRERIKKNKDFDKVLEEVANEVGHEAKTLMNQYLDPALVKKHKGDKKKKSSIALSYKTAQQDVKQALENYIDQVLTVEMVPVRRRKPVRQQPQRSTPAPVPALKDTGEDQEVKSKYMHLDEILVNMGQKVEKGDLIGYSGATGRGITGPHLHVERWIDGRSVDPTDYFQEYYSDARISSPRGRRRLRGGPEKMHHGIDIAIPVGTPIYAMADGVVSGLNENSPSAGKIIVITHS